MRTLFLNPPSFASDIKVAQALKRANPKLVVGFIGAHVAVLPEASRAASAAPVERGFGSRSSGTGRAARRSS